MAKIKEYEVVIHKGSKEERGYIQAMSSKQAGKIALEGMESEGWKIKNIELIK